MALTAMLDANVLWPAALRCTLVRAAIRDLYRAAWTERILDEMAASLKRELGLDPQRVDRTVRLMRENCPHLLVEGYEDLIPLMRNHPKDRHVLAAAVRVGAGTIVTSNTKDLPVHSREPYGVDLQTPDEFLRDLWDSSPDTLAWVLVEQARALARRPMTVFEVVDNLGRTVPSFAREVRGSELLRKAWEQPQREVPLPAFRTL